MRPQSVDSQGWRRGRWLAIIAIIAVLQLALISWLAGRGSAPQPTSPRAVAPRIVIASDSNGDMLSAGDPTYFVRANIGAFSGQSWMQSSAQTYNPPAWMEASPPSNELRAQQLANSLNQYLETNPVTATELLPKTEPEHSEVAPVPINAASTLTISGALAKRSLVQPLKLDSWPGTDTAEVLSNSVVQAGVDGDGNVFSAVLVNSCGSKDADASALSLAESARFEPLDRNSNGSLAKQMWGQMIFHWRTFPVVAATTNTAPTTP